MRGFGLTIEPLAGGAVRVALRGELDLEHAYTFDEELRRIEAARPPCLVLDLRALKFLDSSGLARLLAARHRARRDRRRLVLVRGSAAVQRLMAITAVGQQFETVTDLPAELRAPAGLASQA
ncbi:MAG: STAS domain-containing protein [Solirubrobacteraceae bacterium]